jgi:hypothetical protein
MTIAGREALIVGYGRATITLPMDTQIMMEDVLLYPDSTRALLSFRDVRRMVSMWKHIWIIKRNFFSLPNLLDMANKSAKGFLHSKLNCTLHT